MHTFMPRTVIFEPSALQYPVGHKIYRYFQDKPVEIIKTSLSAFSKTLSELSEKQQYARSKTILAVTRNRQKELQSCKPSADYQFALVSNCPGSCEYCYLQTNQSYKPYLKVYVNLEEIWETISVHISKTQKPVVTFEASSNGDPLAVEHITGSVGATIEYFGLLDKGRLRVATKFNNVNQIVNKRHEGHTRIRISMNTDYVINQFEHGTDPVQERLDAAEKLIKAKYTVGFIIAPIMIYENWKEEYKNMFKNIYEKLKNIIPDDLTFELIQHRYTEPARQRILARFPNTKLDMSNNDRRLKWGKFGQFKYIYQKDDEEELREYMYSMINLYFPDAHIEYFT
ncbi:MAG: spore photoproduct lyase [Clostridiaceae bacterium]|nr:spore photoproduct lyase [Clostridiaceae bacterium]